MNIRTDLALESKEMQSSDDNDGVLYRTEQKEDVLITTVEIINKNGEKKLDKPMGKYITIESKKLKTLDPQTTEAMGYILKEQLSELIKIKENSVVLIVGLGNWNITPDALGPKVVSEIMVTKHLKEYCPELLDEGIRSVCAITPGVMGITGVETSELISGVIKKINPELVIAIDALASRNPERISTTIQITDTGINPGSGVGNKREGLNFKTLGVPVIAIGVPTVVDAAAIAYGVIEKLYDKPEDKENYIKKLFSEETGNFMVTPKEIDTVITHISKVISNGINLALHKNIDVNYIENFVF